MAHEKAHPAQSPGPAEEPTPAAHVRIRLVPENTDEGVSPGAGGSVTSGAPGRAVARA